MTKHNWNRIGSLFHAALERAPDQRTEYLAQACDGDEDLRREVTEMLAAHGAAGRLKVEDHLLADEVIDPLVGRTIGSYRLERLLGRGGMGDVYLAARSDDQYERQVAFKLIRGGSGTESLTTRFLQERQILAQLEHPNIAMLLDGGVTEGGRPYLVMQYVDGDPITDFCRRQDLSLRARLELFRTVCQAVHVAHTNLVVHRDLKPANILVTDDGEVKLLDFGIAKLLDTPDVGATTSLDRLLTPEHAAPEQVAGRPITTATDVYALGVLLYELLTGVRPFEIRSSSPTEIERQICEAPTIPPSTRSPESARTLRGELDNIVMMALRKEPVRRYQSARELDEDIANYLAGRPVRAQRDTWSYRTRKFAGRHRWPVAVAGVFLVVIAGFVSVVVRQSQKVTDERDRAKAEQAKAEEVVEVLTDLLKGSDPTKTADGETLGREDFLALIAERVDGLDAQPEVQARLWELLGGIHFAHSRYPQARVMLDRAYLFHTGPEGDPLAELRIGHTLAVLIRKTEGNVPAEPLLRASLVRHNELLGPRHRDTGIATQDLASALVLTRQAEAMELLDEAMAIAEYAPHADTLAVASVYNHLGIITMNDGNTELAGKNFERALDLMTRKLGDEHPYVLTVTHNLASSRNARGEWKEAEAIHRRLLEIRIRVLGPESQPVARDWDSLANSLAQQGRHDEALAAFAEAERLFRQILGPESGEVSNTVRNSGVVLIAQGRPREAKARFDEAIDISEKILGFSDRITARKRGNRGVAVYVLGNRAQGLEAARAALADVERNPRGEADAYRADLRVMVATLLLAEGRYSEAESLAREALDIRSLRNRDPSVMLSRERCLLAVALAGQGRRAEAGDLLRDNHTRAMNWGLLYPLQRDLIEGACSACEIH